MRVALVSRYFLPYQLGGEEYSTHYLAYFLSKLGLETHVFTSTDSEKRKKIGTEHVESKGNYVVHYLHLDLFGKSILRLLNNFDIIHLQGFWRPTWPYIILRYAHKKKIINTLHGALSASYFEGIWKSLPKRVFDNLITKRLIRKTHKIIALTSWERKFLIKKYRLDPQKILVIPNGIPDEAFKMYKYSITFPYDYVIGLGRISKIKRYDRIIKILPKLPNEIHFVLVGPDGGDLRNLFELSKRLNVMDRFHYLGPKYGKEKYLLLRNAMALVITSSYESFSLVALESIAQKTPVIAPKLPTLSEVLINGEAGVLYSPGNLHELHKAIIQVAEKRESLKKKVERLQPRIRDLSWTRIAKKVKEVYENE